MKAAPGLPGGLSRRVSGIPVLPRLLSIKERNLRMKTLTCLGLALVVLNLEAQVAIPSTFMLSNRERGYGLDSPIFDADGRRLFGSNYVAILYAGPTPDALTPAWFSLGVPAQATVTVLSPDGAGYFRGTRTAYADVMWGQYAWLQVRVWDTLLGSTYDEVAALGQGGYGESNLFQARGGHDSVFGEPPTEPGALIGLESFRLHEVPEPSAAGLALLGAAVLFSSRQGLRRRHGT